MKIFLAADHAGFVMKEQVKVYLKSLGYAVADEGAFSLNPEDDYPDFMMIVAKQVASDPTENRGIIFGASGQGEAMVVNRLPGVRAAVYYGGPEDIVSLSRLHNDANILSIGARFIDADRILPMVHLWLSTEFSAEERHVRRIAKIDGGGETVIPEF